MKNDYSLKKIQVLGISRDFNECECCGKKNLAKTVSILDLDSEVVLHFGVVCAYKADKFDSLTAAAEAKKEIQKEVRKFDDLVKSAGATTWGLLKRAYGIERMEDGSWRPKCSPELYEETRQRVIAHYMNPATKGTPFSL